MADTKILESRLLTRESAIGGSSLSRCAVRLQQYLKVSSEATAPGNEYEAFCRDVSLYQVEMKKYLEIHSMCDDEIKDYEILEKEIEEKISAAQLSIDHLTRELSQQRSLRRHREECENLAKIVNAVPSRAISERRIAQLEEEIARVNEQISGQEAKEKLRLRQFKLIAQAIADMSRSLDEDTEAQNELLLLQQQLQSSADGAGEGEEGEEGENDENDDREEGTGSRDKRTEKSGHMEPKTKKPRLEEVEEEEGEEAPGDGGEGGGTAAADGVVGKEKDASESVSPSPAPSETGRSSPRSAVAAPSLPSSPRAQSASLRQQALASKKVSEPEEGEEDEGRAEEGQANKTKDRKEAEGGMEIVNE